MLDPDPEKRISAWDALSHWFFTDFDDNQMVIESDNYTLNPNFTEFNANYENLKKNMKFAEVNSLIVRDPLITGNTYTINESVNSKGLISSFRSFNGNLPNGENWSNRESILRTVLKNNAN